MKVFSFSIDEKIKGAKLPSLIFKNGHLIVEHPIACKYIISDSELCKIKILISVPKRHIKKAVHRNLIKRRIKESWRQNSLELKTIAKEQKKDLLIGLYYQQNNILDYNDIDSKIKKLIYRLMKLNEKTNS